MEEEANSWIRRANFSHTICHRLDYSRLASFPLNVHPARNSGLKSRPVSETASSGQKSLLFSNQKSFSFPNKNSSVPTNSLAQANYLTNKQRSLSPLPQTIVSDTFKEARSDMRRFSSPHPRGRDQDRGIMRIFFHKESHESKSSESSSNTSPVRHLTSLKGHEKSRNKKDSAWTRYFDRGGGKVNSVEAGDEWTVDMSKLFLGLRFAHGAHSRLYHGLYKDEPVAVKIIRVPDDDENETLAARLEKQFNREVALLSRLRHANIIKFVAACKNQPVYCIITEYLSEGSLRAYLHKLEHKSLPLKKLSAIALDIARGMEYIHSQGVIHRDLKPENILINEEFHMKIADFGIACEEAYCDLLADDPGTYRWMAPEMIKKKSYGRKVDVYSFGLILWEMVAGTIPYEDMIPVQAAFAVVNKNLRPVIPGDCPPVMGALIEQCWSLRPEKRPEFSQIVKVLEQFEKSLAHDGTLNLVQNLSCLDHKKGRIDWIQKLGPPSPSSLSMSKPKFA